MRTVEKVHLKYRFEDKKYRCLYHSVPHTGYAQRAQVAIGFGDVNTFHRGWFVAFGYKVFLNFVKIARYSISQPIDVFNADSIDSRCSLVRLYARPCRFKNLTAMDSVVKSIEPKFRFSFGLAAQFPPQKGDFTSRPRSGTNPSAIHSVMRRLSLKRISSLSVLT
jgi:hypothetical protein